MCWLDNNKITIKHTKVVCFYVIYIYTTNASFSYRCRLQLSLRCNRLLTKAFSLQLLIIINFDDLYVLNILNNILNIKKL